MARNIWNDRRGPLFWRELECSGQSSGVGRQTTDGRSHAQGPTADQERHADEGTDASGGGSDPD